MATVIDQLIVTLGLDASNYKKGTAEAARQQKATQDIFKKSGEAMTRSLTEVARNVAVAFIGFESASGLVSFLAKLNQAQAGLSRMALNFGTSARALDVWDKKIELAGGSVAGAQSAINQLNQDVIALLTQGQVSPLLVFLNKLGVHALDGANKARDAKTVYDELFASLSKLPRAQAFQLATAAGVSPDILNFGLRPQGERDSLAAEAERLSRATDANTKQADDLRERWVAIKDTMEGIGQVFLTKITPVIERLLPVVEKLGNEFADWLNSFATPDPNMTLFDTIDKRTDGLLKKLQSIREEVGKILSGDFSDVPKMVGNAVSNGLNSPSEALDQFKKHDPFFGEQPESALSGIKRWFKGLQGPYQDYFNEASQKYNLPAGLLRGIAQTESSMNPEAVNEKSGARGLMGLNPRFFPDAGQNAFIDINTAAEEMRRLIDAYHGDVDMALKAYNDGQGNLAKHLARGDVPRETENYVQRVHAEMTGPKADTASRPSGPVNNIQIDTVEIHTKATDGKQVGIDFMAEMKKRDLIVQSDTGMIP